MNSVDVNDENRGVCPGGKQSSSVNDHFALDQPTGRPSILRQTENLPSKTVPKGIKVCFQTPRRDPVTKRIVSPTKSLKMTSLDECTKALESLNLDQINASLQDITGQLNEPTQEMSSYPDDNMPVRSKGGYQFDFDNLDAINPFQGSSNVVLSPAKPLQTKTEFALDETLPFSASVENSLVDDISSSRESSVVTVVRLPAVLGEDSSTATPEENQHADTSANVSQDKTSGSFLEDAPLPTKGAYTLDFDNLDDINPFQTGGPKIQNSPVPDRKGLDVTPPAEETQIKETTPEVVDVPAAVQDQASGTVTADEKQPEPSPRVPQEEEASASLVEDAKLAEKGAYTLDFDTLNEINPFQTGGPKIQNSPVLGRKMLDVTLPAEEIKETTPEVVKGAAVLDQAPCTVTAPEPSPCVPQEEEEASASLEDAPLPAKGAYTLDFDTLNEINPFQTGGSKIQNSPVLGRKMLDVTPPAEEIKIKETTPEVVKGAAVLDQAPCTVTAPEPSPCVPQEEEASASLEDAPLPAKGAYTLDFDTLNEINPFQTGGSKIQNSPVLGRKMLDVTPPAEEIKETTAKVVVDVPADVQDAAVLEQAPCNVTAPEPSPRVPQEEEASASLEDAPLPAKGAYTLDFDSLNEINPFQTGGSKIQNSPVLGRKLPDKATKPEAPVQPEVKPVAAVAPISAAAAPAKDGAVKLEFNFDDGNEVKRKPPPKKFGKRPAGVKPKEAKPASDVAPPKEAPVKHEAGDAPPPPKGSYSIDFDKFDDPNFNPFGTTASMSNSPKKPSAALQETPANKPAEKKKAASPAAEVCAAAPVVPEVKAVESLPDTTSEFSEEFVPGTTFMANDFDGQIDYLEQFGSSSFKESALRKQSLYLKFDPLLRESPKKAAGPAGHTHVPRPAAFISRLETPQTAEETANVPQKDDFQLFDVTTPVPPAFGGLVPPFSQSAATEDAIIEVLKYSQKDMDAAIARVQAEMQEKEDQWNAKYKGMLNDGQEMRKIIAEFELVIAKMMADQEQEREAAQDKLKEALLEKEQVSSDLNAMERSFSDLFKRLEKYKAVVEGYKKNEETLKACAQDYLARIKKEEQRYQTLKAHAEEKIGQANEEIAEVRVKNKAEVSTLQAQLRREQLKVQSLERSLEHKEKEADELTKLVDELINKVQKG